MFGGEGACYTLKFQSRPPDNSPPPPPRSRVVTKLGGFGKSKKVAISKSNGRRKITILQVTGHFVSKNNGKYELTG